MEIRFDDRFYQTKKMFEDEFELFSFYGKCICGYTPRK